MSVDIDDIMGQLIGLYILTFTAAESSIGLAIVIILYKTSGVLDIKLLNKLKG